MVRFDEWYTICTEQTFNISFPTFIVPFPHYCHKHHFTISVNEVIK